MSGIDGPAPWSLTEKLRRLAEEVPEVRDAERRLDETVDRVAYRASVGVPRKRFHKSTADRPLDVEG